MWNSYANADHGLRWCSSIIYKALKHKAFEKGTQATVKTEKINNKGEIKLIKVIKAGGSI